MTTEVYNNLMTSLIEVFTDLTEMDSNNVELANTVKKANTMVAITKVCLQAEILARSSRNIKNTLQQNISRIALGLGDEENDD